MDKQLLQKKKKLQESCFKVAQSRWITFIDEQLINMYELCFDSRDEYHICYDEYKVELEC